MFINISKSLLNVALSVGNDKGLFIEKNPLDMPLHPQFISK